ncbi:MAG: hypothetical protein OXF42_07475 [Candidatus Dadabacteria bacterium]|nr:hypothetical protein [Candidatus Dadabacteria bacterium]
MSDKLAEIVDEINKKIDKYEIGGFHAWRKRQNPKLVGGKFLMPSNGKTWTAHRGGRLELQYNVGIRKDENEFRYGVAFSFRKSKTYQFQDLRKHLEPKVQKFNQYVSSHPDLLEEMVCFRYDEAKGKRFLLKDSIPNNLVKEGVFIFFGKTCKVNERNYDEILRTFDRLFPLYKVCGAKMPLVEGEDNKREGVSSNPGFNPTSRSTERTIQERTIQTEERHDKIKDLLYKKKVREHGKQNVDTEWRTDNGQSVDLVVLQGSKRWFYEIKVQDNDRLCIREAMGQLLEYSYWPGCEVAERLIVVGEPKLTKKGEAYLKTLREKFNIPVFYEQITL